MSAFLTPEELHHLTGKRRYSAQRRALLALRIFVEAATGEPLVRVDTRDGADLRAAAASAIERRGGEAAAQAFLGHKDIRTTMVYLRDRRVQ